MLSLPIFFFLDSLTLNSSRVTTFQVNALLCSLDIDSSVRGKGPMPERFRELEDYWNESQGNLRLGPPAPDGWISEFSQQREKYDNPDSWANSFEQQYGANGWVSEFEHVRSLYFSISRYNLKLLTLFYMQINLVLSLLT